MKALLSKFVRDEDGAALVEYGVALLVVILVGTAALVTLSTDVGNQFSDACTATEDVRTAAVAVSGGTASTGNC
jgi:pilus assembly protein Flp/PilA